MRSRTNADAPGPPGVCFDDSFRRPGFFLVAATGIMLYAAFMHLHLLLAYPPGVDLDAGLNGLEALKPLRYGVWPFYILNNSNPDPVFVYMQSLATALFGARVIALRLPSIFSGWLGFAALFATLIELGRGEFDRVTRHRIALLAAAALATSQVLALLHRMGLRFSTAALFELLAVWALARAVRVNQRRSWLIAGALAGLTQYTYPTARVVPLLLLLVFLIKAWRHPQGLRALWPGARAYLLAAASVLLPQIIWYAANPETLLARASQTGLHQHPLYAEAGPVAVIWAKLQLYWEALGSYWLGQYNHIKEPLLAKVFYGGFILGIPLVLFYIRRRLVLVLLAGLAVMVLPEMIAGASDWPHELRLIGAYPFVAAVAGLGLGGAWSLLRRWPVLDTVAGVALLGAVAFSMYAEADEFFSLDRNYSKLYWNQNWWLGRIEAGVGALVAESDESYLLPLQDYRRNAIKYLTAQRATVIESAVSRDGQLRPPLRADQEITLLLPHKTDTEAWSGDPTQWVLIRGEAAYVLPPLAEPVDFLPAMDESTLLYGSGAEAIVALGHARKVALRDLNLADSYRAQYPLSSCFASGVCLGGVSYEGALRAGANLRVHIFWTITDDVDRDYTFFIHLLDASGNAIAGEDAYPLMHGYRTYEWHPDDLVLTTHNLAAPPDLQPGRYAVEVGMYALPSIGRVRTVDASGVAGDDRVVFSHLKLPRSEVVLPADYEQAGIEFAGWLELVGYRVDELPTLDRPLALTLWWRALRPSPEDWTAFFHLTPEANNAELASQLDRTVSGGAYPPSVWDVGELVEEHVQIGSGVPEPGRYTLWMGLYSPQTLERVPISRAAAAVESDRALLLVFEIGS